MRSLEQLAAAAQQGSSATRKSDEVTMGKRNATTASKQSSPSAETVKKPRLQGPERRAKFLEAAAQIVVEHGVSFVTMEEVAARTGVNKRLGYRYFTNREELLRALLDQELEESGRRARAILSPKPDLPERVTVNVRVWLQLVSERGPLLSRLLADEEVSPTLAKEANARAIADWSAVLRSELGVAKAPAEILARLYIAALRGAVEALAAKVATLDQIVTSYATMVLTSAYQIAGKPRPR
jgi:AcrR family transcriptional regulator